MARTTSSLVQGVLLADYDAARAPSLTPFIDTASALVDRLESSALAEGVTLAASLLELIERWLAAHCYVQTDRQYQSKSTGGASASFMGQSGLGLKGSTYGQTALRLDYTGFLATVDTPETPVRRVAGAAWLGKAASEQTPYHQRD